MVDLVFKHSKSPDARTPSAAARRRREAWRRSPAQLALAVLADKMPKGPQGHINMRISHSASKGQCIGCQKLWLVGRKHGR